MGLLKKWWCHGTIGTTGRHAPVEGCTSVEAKFQMGFLKLGFHWNDRILNQNYSTVLVSIKTAQNEKLFKLSFASLAQVSNVVRAREQCSCFKRECIAYCRQTDIISYPFMSLVHIPFANIKGDYFLSFLSFSNPYIFIIFIN